MAKKIELKELASAFAIGAYCERYCNERARLTLLEMKK